MRGSNKGIHKETQSQELFLSSLHNEDTFYCQFITDLQNATKEVIIESPFITSKRLNTLLPIFTQLKSKNIAIFIITRDPKEHDKVMAVQSELGIQWFENIGIQVLLENGGHHRKLAMIDKRITYEGSLNILSQMQSREFMRRIECNKLTKELYEFLRYDRFSQMTNGHFAEFDH
jgi:hypothetical protein